MRLHDDGDQWQTVRGDRNRDEIQFVLIHDMGKVHVPYSSRLVRSEPRVDLRNARRESESVPDVKLGGLGSFIAPELNDKDQLAL